jgi:hypothetical protein
MNVEPVKPMPVRAARSFREDQCPAGLQVMYPLREALLLVGCGTIARGGDYDDIVDWANAHVALLRSFAEFHFGTPCARLAARTASTPTCSWTGSYLVVS